MLNDMENVEYRVKILEKRDGSRAFIPQKVTKVTDFLSTLVWGKHVIENILSEDNESEDFAWDYDTEEEALKEIEKYKAYLIYKEGQKVENIEYKKV